MKIQQKIKENSPSAQPKQNRLQKEPSTKKSQKLNEKYNKKIKENSPPAQPKQNCLQKEPSTKKRLEVQ